MVDGKLTSEKDRLNDRSNIGVVEFPIEKLMKFRDAEASCVHIEAAMEADRGLTDTGKNARSNPAAHRQSEHGIGKSRFWEFPPRYSFNGHINEQEALS